MNRKISVVVPTYKRSELLIRCLDALLNQSIGKSTYEIIVVSDGPDPVTAEAIKVWTGFVHLKVSYYPLPEKKGPAAARNYGWKKAKGELIAFTDDDCIPDQDWLASLLAAYHDEEELVISGQVIVPLPENPTDFERNTAHLETAEFITANCACTKKALWETGGFDEHFEQAWREDSDLHFKTIRHKIPLKKVNEAIVVHPVRRAPWGISIKEQRKGMYNALLYKKYPELYKSRIRSKAPWSYYTMIFTFLIGCTLLLMKSEFLALISFSAWLVLLLLFISRRLAFTSHSPKHVAEMIVTSIFIPFLSVYWQFYGALKYRVLFF
ncbi:glycosyltransferase family 2 protein [Arcticibacter eurypsychrophilus]|uniref:glycosyltransferase family 2 protein n=1 Tax=Arcticibacter eurypsychrophilus TaxID=1434752 RepID=UPI00084DBE48|nr:glycosyltransferase [Arcticibacter eurypsychrophilus]